MKKILLLVLSALLLASCSSKTVTVDALGKKSITTKTDASAFSDAQAIAWQGYYQAMANPPVIATITHPSGDVITINSQVPPPAPVIRQHQNQYIGPVTGMIKTGVQIIGGGLVVREIVDSLQGTHITNTGAGNVTYDRSESVTVETVHAEGGATLNQASNNPDNHVEKADPVIVEQEKVVVVEPEVVRPEVVVVQPSYPPAE